MKTNKKPTGDNLLLKAVEKGDLKTVRERIAAGADMNAAAKGEAPPLFVAVSRGHLKVVEELISAGVEVNRIAYPRGASVKASPLSVAIDGGHWEIMQTLLQAGAQVALEHYPGENAAGEAAEKAINAWYRTNGSDEDGFGKAQSKREKARLEEECKRWMQFVRDAIAAGVKVRDYWLWSAARHGFAELATMLIAAGTNVNAAPHMSSALESAIEGGHLEIVTALVKAGAALKPARESGTPTLLLAASIDRNDIVSVLLDAGANINAAGDVALSEFSFEDAAVEEEKNAKGNVTSRSTHLKMPTIAEASTAVIVAVRRGNAGLVKLLAERGADLSLGDKHGVTALTCATRGGREDIAGILKVAGAAAAEFEEGSSASALLAAAQRGDVAAIQKLLSKGAEVNAMVKDREGHHVALIEAARAGHLAAVQTLLKAGADVNAVVQESFTGGITALMLAAEKRHPEVVSALLSAGARIDLKDFGYEGGGEAAIHYAARGGDTGVIRSLLAAGAKPVMKAKGGTAPLLIAVSKRKREAAEALLQAGADPNSGPSDGSGPLWHAADNLDVPMLRLLLKHGATPVPRAKEPVFLPLTAAADKGSVEVVKLLLEAGALINAADGIVGGALAGAALHGHADVVEVLLVAGADPNRTPRNGFTPLMAAVRGGKKPAVELLLKAGADPNRRNESGETALDLARRDKARSLLPLLEAAGALTGKKAKKAAGEPARKQAKPIVQEELEQPDFSAVAKTPAYKTLVAEIAALCGSEAEPLSDFEGCFSFKVARGHGEKMLAEHHRRLLDQGAYLFRHHRDYVGDKDKLGLMPTKEWADLIAAFQTNGANYDLMPAGVVKWLKELEQRHPFELTGGGFDWLEGKFLQRLSKTRKLAHEMYEFCSDIVDQGIGSVKDLVRALEKDGSFFFWWD